MTAPDVPEPVVLGDRYELGQLLGRGGMAEVYLGHDRVLKRRVAIKLLSTASPPAPGEAQRLRGEARAAALIDHPNVVTVFDIALSGATVFVVMEYLEGEPLRARLHRDGSLQPDVAVVVAAQVCQALEAAHRAGVIHRDIGPGNIMLCGQTVKVMDFGLARIAGNVYQTAAGQVLGTPAYLSPEQAGGGPVDARSDVYSLGCSLYHMVTGRTPFTGDTPAEVARQHVEADVLPPSALAPGIPKQLETVILTAMAKSPDCRFANAAQMRTELLAALPQIPASTARGAAPPAAPGDPAKPEPVPDDLDTAAIGAADAALRRMRLGVVLIVVSLAALAIASAALLAPGRIG